MAVLNEQDFKKEILSGNFSQLYLIYGEEKYLVKKYTEYIYSKLIGKKSSDFDSDILSSDADLQSIADAAEQLPLMSEKRCVCVNDFDFESISESDLKSLIAFCSDLPESTVLIFSQPTLTSDSKKTNKTKKFSTMAEKVGTVLHCEKRGEIALERNIISWAKKLGCEIDEINAAKLIASCGTDMNTLENETQKLCAYVGSGIIADDAIKAVAVRNTEARIFALSDSIIRRDYNSAYKQLDLLFYQREKPEVILGVLSSAFVDIYRVRTAIESGEKASALKDIFPYKGKEFRLRNAERDMKQYSNNAISKILDAIAYADIRLKSNVGNQRTVLEMLIAKILLIVKEDSGK